jgi:hypothetical protein
VIQTGQIPSNCHLAAAIAVPHRASEGHAMIGRIASLGGAAALTLLAFAPFGARSITIGVAHRPVCMCIWVSNMGFEDPGLVRPLPVPPVHLIRPRIRVPDISCPDATQDDPARPALCPVRHRWETL